MRSTSRSGRVVSIVLLLGLSIALILPLYSVVKVAFQADGQWSFDNVSRFLNAPGMSKSIVNTVVITVFTGLLSTVLGVVLATSAVLLPSGRVMRRLYEVIPLVPLTVPAIVGALGWLFLLSPRNGWLNIVVRWLVRSDSDVGPFNAFSLVTVVFVTSLYVVPFVYTVVAASLRRVNSEGLEAMLIYGSTPLQMLRQSITGSLRPALFAAGTLAFVNAISMFSVPLILQVDVLTTYIYRNATVVGNPGLAAIASMPLLVISLALSTFQLSLMRKSTRFATVTGKGTLGRKVSLGRGLDRVFKSFSVLYLFLTGILPLGAVALVSLLPFWKSRFSISDLSLDQYRAVLDNRQVINGFQNSLRLGIFCAIGAVVLAVLILLFSDRLRDPFGRAAFAVGNLPLGVPIVVLGLGFLSAFIGPPIVLYGTIWLLILAYLVCFLPLAMRNVGPVMSQVSWSSKRPQWSMGARSAVRP
ncbi:MAG: hypothetical protein QM733_13360 [Ilumatobacteraceae bacterium]